MARAFFFSLFIVAVAAASLASITTGIVGRRLARSRRAWWTALVFTHAVAAMMTGIGWDGWQRIPLRAEAPFLPAWAFLTMIYATVMFLVGIAAMFRAASTPSVRPSCTKPDVSAQSD